MNQTFVLSCLIFILFLFFLPGNPLPMFADPDTGRYVIAGDVIRELGHVPLTDVWSFTAGDEKWLNTAWGYDVVLSLAYQHFGWYGPVAVNSLLLAATVALIFAACFIRSAHGIASFVIAFAALRGILGVTIRSFQMSYVLIAALALLLAQIARGRCSPRWLLIVPVLMVLWVNAHGEFTAAFLLMGVYGVVALAQKDRRFTGWLAAAGIFSLMACMLNPYGLGIIEAVLRIMHSLAKPFIIEWKPLVWSWDYSALWGYLAVFIALGLKGKLSGTAAEKILACLLLALGLLAMRHFSLFVIVTAPMIAPGVHDFLTTGATRKKLPDWFETLCKQTTDCAHTRTAAMAAALAALVLCLLVFSPAAPRLYAAEGLNPLPDMSGEIAFIEAHHPHARLLNYYDLGEYLIFTTHGKIPVFIDGRAEEAYPAQVMRDYLAFHTNEAGWENILDHYRIDGVLVPVTEKSMMERFTGKPGWRLAFQGKTAALFLRR